jgi:thiol-disulfide isomerase/thioredoxin
MKNKPHSSLFTLLLTTASLLLSSLCLAAPPRPFVQGSYADILAAHQDRPFFVALWSIDCPPCREELPEMAAYFAKHPQISLVLISTDGKGFAEQTQALLQKNGLGDAESWIFADPFVEKLRYEVDSTWQGELPRSYFYSPDQPPQRIRGRVNFKQLEVSAHKHHP